MRISDWSSDVCSSDLVAFETRTDEVQRRAADLVGFDHEIGQVAMMRAHRIFAAMLRAGRVPVRARAREVGRRALADAMDVHTISAGTEAACDELDAQARRIAIDVGAAAIGALRIIKLETGRAAWRERVWRYV